MQAKWKETSLAAVMDVKHGFAFPGDNIRDEPPGDILLTPGNFSVGGGFKGDKFKYFEGEVPDDYVLDEGDLIVTMTDLSKQADTLGYPALVPKPRGPRFLHNQRLGKVLIKRGAELDRVFLFYLLRTEEYRHEVLASATGTTVKHTSPGRILAHKAGLPPLAEQKAIASVLGALDAKIELNRRMNATLEAMARALFQSWFVDFDPIRAKLDRRQPPGLDKATAALFPTTFQGSETGQIPLGWRKTTLGEEVDFFTGFAFQSGAFSSSSDSVRLARGDNVKEGFFHWDSKTRYWPAITPELERYRLSLGDVLIGMDGSKVGKNWVRVRKCDLPCLLVQRVARLRAKQSIGQHFVWLLISDSRFRFHVDGVKTGTSIPHISGGQIKAYDFVRPPLGDNRLFHRFEELVAPFGEQMDFNIEQSLRLATLRDTLLPKLLSGELSAVASHAN